MISSAEIESRVFIKGRNINKFPVNLEEVVNKLDLSKPVKIVYDSKLPLEIGAYTHRNIKKYYIFVNANHPLSRQRFSIAHEIAHLHFRHEEVSLHTWDHKDLFHIYQEMEADEFAAGLLMPSKEIYILANYCGKDIPSLLSRVQDFFNVSLSAASQRITRLNLFEGAIILKSRNRTCFKYCTDNYNGFGYKEKHIRRLTSGKELSILVAETFSYLV